jgi:hypothetical protein
MKKHAKGGSFQAIMLAFLGCTILLAAGCKEEETTEEKVTLSSIQVTAYPKKTVFLIDELFNPSGMVVMGYYSNSSAKQEYNYSLSGFNSSTAGIKTITVTASGKTATFTVQVIDSNVRLASISLNTTSVKKDYQCGDILDLTGLIVTGTYTDASTATIPYNEWEAAPVNGSILSTPGINIITINVGNCLKQFNVNVNLNETSINLTIGMGSKNAVIYGIPDGQEDNILIYWNKRLVGFNSDDNTGGNQAKPHEITISASEEYTYTEWYIDNARITPINRNIITIKAEDHTLDIPHNITFIGKIEGGLRYSKTLTFTVLKQGDR